MLTEKQRTALSNLALYLLGGLVFYVFALSGLAEVGITDVVATVLALGFALLLLEALTHAGWLTKPLAAEERHADESNGGDPADSDGLGRSDADDRSDTGERSDADRRGGTDNQPETGKRSDADDRDIP